MIYLTTGANGAGKTLNTLKHVREKQVAESRSVYYNGFDMSLDKAAEFGWQKFDPREWQSLPDGAILICDECQNEFPTRGTSATLPEYIRALSEHRKRGFDFFMITQHPQNIDQFVRRLIGTPGWHRHLKRSSAINMVSQLEWAAVNATCEKTNSGKDARITLVPFPKEVFSWYASATLHTAKRSIPRQFFVIAACLFLIPALLYFGFKTVYKNATKGAPAALPTSSAVGPQSAVGVKQPVENDLAEYTPRVVGLVHTAPRYDDATKPVAVPVPAACLSTKTRCSCYTQQATVYSTTDSVCRQIFAGGFFEDFDRGGVRQEQRQEPKQNGLQYAPVVPQPPAQAWAATDARILSSFKGGAPLK
jgi:zona occludens toxin